MNPIIVNPNIDEISVDLINIIDLIFHLNFKVICLIIYWYPKFKCQISMLN